MTTFHFLSGLPRSGSTLLSSILNQNPDIYSGPNSPMCGMMFNLERSILASEQYNAYPKPQVLPATICGVLESYYSDINENIIIDKSREWSIKEHFEVLLRNMPYDPKVILTVRSINEILASFMYLVHTNPQSASFIDQEIEARQEFNYYRHPDEIRCDHLMRPKGLIDNALYGIAYAMLEENRKYFHIVEYNDLVYKTQETLGGIYEFLGIEKFNHDLNNIRNIAPENDKIYGLEGMHEVRPSIDHRKINIAEHLSPYVLNKYSNLEFWRNVDPPR
jgi:sulfotransferase